MNELLALHQLAALRGDGLRSELKRLLEHRARIERDPAIVDLAPSRPDGTVQAGPCPAGDDTGFMPGNVVPMESKPAAPVPARVRGTST